MVFPITFSIPESKIVKSIPNKTKTLSDLIPGRLDTYIYQNEEDYYQEYQQSMFAITTKKAGWDCMRHYEIMANGCIPYFPDIQHCPPNTMYLLPKDLILEGNKLFERLHCKPVDHLTSNELIECYSLIEKFLNYLLNFLTTKQLARYVLNKSHNSEVSNVLILSGQIHEDYMRDLTLHGLKELFGTKCHDYPKVPHIYQDSSIDYSKLYGKGITYCNLLYQDLHDLSLDESVEEDIKNKKYDLIIYGNYHRGMPFYDLVKQVYESHKIILLCGEDIHCCNFFEYNETVFVREL
jgi:hypothetical protein